MNKHTFAHQFLKNLDISIYAGNSQILHSDDTINKYILNDINTSFVLHRHVSVGNKSIVRIESYQDILKLGFQISKRRVQGNLFYGQKVEYFLVKIGMGHYDLGTIPPEHVVEYNPIENWIRLIGRNSTGKKVFIFYKKGSYHKEIELEDYEKIYEDFIIETSPFTFQEEEKRIIIPEIPVVLADDGRLVCLPHTRDLPKIGIFGAPGKGKTLVLHALADLVHWKWKKRCIIANDNVSFQTKSWGLPWDNEKHKEFIKKLEIIGHTTIPLPCVYLFQNTNDLIDVELENEVSYRTSLPFKDIISSPAFFFKDVENLGASEKYLTGLIYNDEGKIRPDGLFYAKSINDVINLINEQTTVEQGKLLDSGQLVEQMVVYKIPNDSVRAKLASLFQEIWNLKIFDINTQISSKWIVQMPDGTRNALFPWRACLYSNLIPVQVTNHIIHNKYFPAYYNFMLNDLFNMQQEPLNKKNEIELWVFLDEIHSLFNHTSIFNKIKEMMKQGRPNRVAFVYATQYFGDISPDIELITDYIISFQQTTTEGKKILENFDAMRHQVKLIRMLPKYHAMIAGKSGNPLIVYDTEGKKEMYDDGTPFKGIIFPSVSQHSAPKKEGI